MDEQWTYIPEMKEVVKRKIGFKEILRAELIAVYNHMPRFIRQPIRKVWRMIRKR